MKFHVEFLQPITVDSPVCLGNNLSPGCCLRAILGGQGQLQNGFLQFHLGCFGLQLPEDRMFFLKRPRPLDHEPRPSTPRLSHHASTTPTPLFSELEKIYSQFTSHTAGGDSYMSLWYYIPFDIN